MKHSLASAFVPRKTIGIEASGSSGWANAASVGIDPTGGYGSHSKVAISSLTGPPGGWNGAPGTWPPFLLDLLPQWGRKYLAASAGLSSDVDDPASQCDFLRLAGGSPIGNLRVIGAEPCTWDRPGWTEDELFRLDQSWSSLASDLASSAPGAFGLQGAWPKFMVTRGADGLWLPDHAVPDDQARDHSIIKWGADEGEVTRVILSSEAPYVEMARAFGLRCARPLKYSGGVLLIPRFDRRSGSGKGTIRLAQGSIGAASGLVNFGVYGRHETYLNTISIRCSHPLVEMTEYVLRDLFNQATGNSDNHGRNTALLRSFDGTMQLSPLYDICPQGLSDPEERRATVWDSEDGGKLPTDWEAVCALCGNLWEAELRIALASRGPLLREMPDLATSMGVPPMALAVIKESCGRLADAVEKLDSGKKAIYSGTSFLS